MTGTRRHLLGIALLAVALALPAAQKSSKQVEQERKALAQKREQLQRQVAKDRLDLGRSNREVEAAERAVAGARGSLRELREKRAERAAARQKLVNQRVAREAERERHRNELESQLRSAYMIGRNEPLKLLLNQRNINEISRTLTYYGYFGRMRAGQIAKLEQDVAEIEELTARIDAEDAELARLEQQEKSRLGDLDQALKQRGLALASLEKESRSRNDQLARLQKQEKQLEKQLEELSRARRSAPFDPNTPFARARGKLAWPVAGRIEVDFNEVIGGTLRSSGIQVRAKQGAEVRVVHDGEVIHADWAPNRGLLVIVDHFNGYWSLYGHNEQLFKKKGDRVNAGDVIATVGDTGGRDNPGLYFEIRSDVDSPQNRAGKPVNPHPWFRTPEPPAR